ncbi:hypothetical protein QVD17_06863 [Tagetes erecta]|uniref:Uncharacterized protein n=1 Tax=Tagetes erecta TaxID=13708 RepID=A0AAD8LMM3_TARER|nr:hypothetical protein QVD17_06863 [Tagetes erecta]
MDQQKSWAKSKNIILKLLPRATSSVSFQNPCPSKDKFRSSEKPHKSHLGVGFSDPLIMVDTRREIKNNSNVTVEYEPTSPRVSCIGQVKCKYIHRAGNKPHIGYLNVEDGHKKIGFKKIFGRGKLDAGKKSLKAPDYLDKAPSLSTMKRFSSGRDKLSGVDCRRYDYHDESDVIIPSSAPVMIRNLLGFDDGLISVVGNMEPRKEINLWKRRTMPLLIFNQRFHSN